MLKKIFATLLALLAAAAFAAVDVNNASQAELEAVKGIGPALSQRLLDERKKGVFKGWPDVIERVKGIGSGNAARFSADGLTVNGSAYAGAPKATTAAAKTPTGRRNGMAASQPAASASTTATAIDKPATTGAPAAAGIDKPARKAAGAASASRAVSSAAPSPASAAKAGAKP